ncbi:hypothetical protein GCM10009665_78350 [Kitasatospora nipponensis]|uniref:Nudix hydrolase domain-containing protein n=1 Tax=Kitasatospora nipponensis TaxID=258049 RepID=A0ABN1TA48_9ACTN
MVVDPDGAVFLLRSENVEVGPHWCPPGGGLDPGESPEEGARRELREETGWEDLEPEALLCTWEHDFTRHGVPVRQHEHVYLARGPRRGPLGDVSQAHAVDRILAWRWWSPEDLADRDAEPLWPPTLPALVEAVRTAWAAGRPGPSPAHLGYLPNPPGAPAPARPSSGG